MALLVLVVIVHIRFVVLPVFFLLLGLLTYLWSGRKALVLFIFLLPLINSTPDLFFNGYPFNYMGIALFYFSGIMIASGLKKEKPEFTFPGFGIYNLFLLIIAVSVFFVFLRWSNMTLSPLACLRDTPVAPSGDRLSFACIFPVITLALFSLTPFLAALIRHWHFKENDIFLPLKAGFCLSFLVALVQKWLDPGFLAQSWWRLQLNQVNGGFSDFNAFGFFAGAMFLYQALQLTEKLSRRHGPADLARDPDSAPWLFEILFLMVALAAIFISGCRTAFLFVVLAVCFLLFSKKTGVLVKLLVMLLLLISLLVAGGTLKRRLQNSFVQTAHVSNVDNLVKAANSVSSGRLNKLKDSLRMVGRFPVSGVGAGNFLFYLKYLRFNERAYMDLPLNQYLLFITETGLPGCLLFILFLTAVLQRQKKGALRFVTASIVFAIFFNNFFWFPECLLLFWIFLSASDWRPAPEPRLKPLWLWGTVAVLVVFQLLDFRTLHPESLTRKNGIAYDYGFWPGEKSGRGPFSWTRGAAGIYFAAGRAREFAIFCGAPHEWLQKEGMVVKLFWRGKLFQRVVFFKNQLKKFQLPRLQEGFLEIRVHPTFSPKSMNLGSDERELGVQFMAAAMPRP